MHLGLGLAAAMAFAAAPDVAASAARREVEAATTARTEGRLDDAIVHYRRALELRPAAALHYNIAVCHHHLTLETDADMEASQRHRRAAIVAYRDYLATAGDPPDRRDVEAHLRTLELGLASPVRSPEENGWETATPPADPPPTTASAPSEAPQFRDVPPPPMPPPAAVVAPAPSAAPAPSEPRHGPRGWTRAHFVLGVDPRGEGEGVSAAPSLGVLLGIAGLLGRRRGASIGGEVRWGGQPISARERPRRSGWHVAIEAGYGKILGSGRRVELRVTGLLGLAGQRLATKTPTNLSCPRHRTGLIDRRMGARMGGRLSLQVLLGAQRRHEVGLLVTPFGTAFTGDDILAACRPAPFEELGLPMLEFELDLSLGYGLRF